MLKLKSCIGSALAFICFGRHPSHHIVCLSGRGRKPSNSKVSAVWVKRLGFVFHRLNSQQGLFNSNRSLNDEKDGMMPSPAMQEIQCEWILEITKWELLLVGYEEETHKSQLCVLSISSFRPLHITFDYAQSALYIFSQQPPGHSLEALLVCRQGREMYWAEEVAKFCCLVRW